MELTGSELGTAISPPTSKGQSGSHQARDSLRLLHDFCQSWGIEITILPMSDDPVATIVITAEHGELAFQEYFVHQHCESKSQRVLNLPELSSRDRPSEYWKSIAECGCRDFLPVQPLGESGSNSVRARHTSGDQIQKKLLQGSRPSSVEPPSKDQLQKCSRS